MSSSLVPLDPYETLGVSRRANTDVIRRVHRKLVLKHHPDRIKDPSLVEWNQKVFTKVQIAVDSLIDPSRRQKYHDVVDSAENSKLFMIPQSRATSCHYSVRHDSFENVDLESPPRARRQSKNKAMSMEENFGIASDARVIAQAREWKETYHIPGRRVYVEEDYSEVGRTQSSASDEVVVSRHARVQKPSPPPRLRRRSTTAPYQSLRRASPRPEHRAMEPSDDDSEDDEEYEHHLRNAQAYFFTASKKSLPTAKRPRRSQSVRSNASSTNQSLRNTRRGSFDRSYQKPEFARRRTGSASSYEVTRESRRLPPDPGRHGSRHPEGLSRLRGRERSESPSVDSKNGPVHDVGLSLKEEKDAGTFEKRKTRMFFVPGIPEQLCYLCNTSVNFSRKRDWQRHLYNDLKPYQCIELDCREAETTFGRLKALVQHYKTRHPLAQIMLAPEYKCLFCEGKLSNSIAIRFKHIGRHLEDHALSVVPRQQEDWEFYSDSNIE